MSPSIFKFTKLFTFINKKLPSIIQEDVSSSKLWDHVKYGLLMKLVDEPHQVRQILTDAEEWNTYLSSACTIPWTAQQYGHQSHISSRMTKHQLTLKNRYPSKQLQQKPSKVLCDTLYQLMHVLHLGNHIMSVTINSDKCNVIRGMTDFPEKYDDILGSAVKVKRNEHGVWTSISVTISLSYPNAQRLLHINNINIPDCHEWMRFIKDSDASINFSELTDGSNVTLLAHINYAFQTSDTRGMFGDILKALEQVGWDPKPFTVEPCQISHGHMKAGAIGICCRPAMASKLLDIFKKCVEIIHKAPIHIFPHLSGCFIIPSTEEYKRGKNKELHSKSVEAQIDFIAETSHVDIIGVDPSIDFYAPLPHTHTTEGTEEASIASTIVTRTFKVGGKNVHSPFLRVQMFKDGVWRVYYKKERREVVVNVAVETITIIGELAGDRCDTSRLSLRAHNEIVIARFPSDHGTLNLTQPERPTIPAPSSPSPPTPTSTVNPAQRALQPVIANPAVPQVPPSAPPSQSTTNDTILQYLQRLEQHNLRQSAEIKELTVSMSVLRNEICQVTTHLDTVLTATSTAVGKVEEVRQEVNSTYATTVVNQSEAADERKSMHSQIMQALSTAKEIQSRTLKELEQHKADRTDMKQMYHKLGDMIQQRAEDIKEYDDGLGKMLHSSFETLEVAACIVNTAVYYFQSNGLPIDDGVIFRLKEAKAAQDEGAPTGGEGMEMVHGDENQRNEASEDHVESSAATPANATAPNGAGTELLRYWNEYLDQEADNAKEQALATPTPLHQYYPSQTSSPLMTQNQGDKEHDGVMDQSSSQSEEEDDHLLYRNDITTFLNKYHSPKELKRRQADDEPATPTPSSDNTSLKPKVRLVGAIGGVKIRRSTSPKSHAETKSQAQVGRERKSSLPQPNNLDREAIQAKTATTRALPKPLETNNTALPLAESSAAEQDAPQFDTRQDDESSTILEMDSEDSSRLVESADQPECHRCGAISISRLVPCGVCKRTFHRKCMSFSSNNETCMECNPSDYEEDSDNSGDDSTAEKRATADILASISTAEGTASAPTGGDTASCSGSNDIERKGSEDPIPTQESSTSSEEADLDDPNDSDFSNSGDTSGKIPRRRPAENNPHSNSSGKRNNKSDVSTQPYRTRSSIKRSNEQ
jgi:hypothetical protein